MQRGKKSHSVAVPGGVELGRIIDATLILALLYHISINCSNSKISVGLLLLLAFFSSFFSFCHFDPPLSHPPGAVWSHTVAFPRLAAATAGTWHNQRREEGRSAGTVITVTAGGGTLLRDSRREGGGGNHLTPSVFSCGFTHRTYSPAPIANAQFTQFTSNVTFRKQTLQGEKKKGVPPYKVENGDRRGLAWYTQVVECSAPGHSAGLVLKPYQLTWLRLVSLTLGDPQRPRPPLNLKSSICLTSASTSDKNKTR